MEESLSTKVLITFSAAGLSIILDTAKPFIIAMIVFVLLDYLTGIIKSIYLKDLDSKTATKGLLKKLTFFIAAHGVGYRPVLQHSVFSRHDN